MIIKFIKPNPTKASRILRALGRKARYAAKCFVGFTVIFFAALVESVADLSNGALNLVGIEIVPIDHGKLEQFFHEHFSELLGP